MKVYHYHPETLDFFGESEAFESPLETGVYLVPAFATLISPPDTIEGFRTVWNGQTWVNIEIPEVQVIPEKPAYDAENFKEPVWDDSEWEWVITEMTDEEKLLRSYQVALSDGYTVTPENFILKLDFTDRSAFTSMLLLVKEALSLGLITDATPQTIEDKDGVIHTVTTLRFRQIMVQYGFYYKSLWDAIPR